MKRISNKKAKVTVEIVCKIELKKIIYGHNGLTTAEKKIWDRWESAEQPDDTMTLQKRIKFEAMSRKENNKRMEMGLAPRVLRPKARCP